MHVEQNTNINILSPYTTWYI